MELQQGGTTLLQLGDGGLHLEGAASNPNVSGGPGTITLTQAQYRYPLIVAIGSLGGNNKLAFPTVVGARWTVDLTGVTFNGHTLTLTVNSNDWTTVPAAAGVWEVVVGNDGKFHGIALV